MSRAREGPRGPGPRPGDRVRRTGRKLAHAAWVALQIVWWTVTFQLRSRLRGRRDARVIRRSGLFHADYYLAQATGDREAHRNPIEHYLTVGAAAGLDPNPLFDTSYYLERYRDVAESGTNPLAHYVARGAAEGRNPSALFDTSRYVAAHPEAATSGKNPLAHHLATAALEEGPIPATVWRMLTSDALERVAGAPVRALRVLVADHRVLTPDQDSGSVRMFEILTLLRELGHEVTFLSDSPAQAPPYEAAIRRLGISVHLGYWNALAHLAEHGLEYRFALLSRPAVAHRYLPAVRAFAPFATVVYDTVDLHWLRLERAADITGDPAARAQADEIGRVERAAAACADVVLAITAQERDAIAAAVPGARIEIIPNVHRCRPTSRPAHAREGLLFIGGFEHEPNVDAVRWFVSDVLPLVQRRLPGTVLEVVGSKPTAEVLQLASPTVRVAGYVPDAEPFFERCRVFVSPLRYGAGMKGKIGHALALGLPVVTTSAGAEGMMLSHGDHVLVADGAAAFADAVVHLYGDELLWTRLSRNGTAHVQSHFSPEAVRPRLAALFPAARVDAIARETRTEDATR